MNYKVTRTYPRSKELLLAGFLDIDDAQEFIHKKISIDESSGKKVLYRIYDDINLIFELHNEMQSGTDAEDPESFDHSNLAYSLKVLLEPDLDKSAIAYFNDQDDAKLFALLKCSLDSRHTYIIYKGNVMIERITTNTIASQKLKEDSQAVGKSSSFKPTPLKTRPTPPGGPSDCWEDNEKDE
ncbi:TPA: hypothetical protein ACGWTM_001737 [Legionella pneumophila]